MWRHTQIHKITIYSIKQQNIYMQEIKVCTKIHRLNYTQTNMTLTHTGPPPPLLCGCRAHHWPGTLAYVTACAHTLIYVGHRVGVGAGRSERSGDTLRRSRQDSAACVGHTRTQKQQPPPTTPCFQPA